MPNRNTEEAAKGRWEVKLSEKKRDAIYGAINEKIMKLRIKLKKHYGVDDGVDIEIAQTISPTFVAVLNALGASSEDEKGQPR